MLIKPLDKLSFVWYNVSTLKKVNTMMRHAY